MAVQFAASNILHGVFGLPDWHIVAFVSSWLFYYTFIHALYYPGGALIKTLIRVYRPNALANQITKVNVVEQIKQSEIAFPLYCCVPASGDMVRRFGLSRVCDDFEACGGIPQSILNFAIYMFLVEGGVFFVHYWMLHVWPWGKANLKHSVHHKYKESNEMTSWAGYAFEASDGASQGVPFVLFQCFVPIPLLFALLSGLTVGLWTMYIHVGEPSLPWPFMGADYHYIHHRDNWYNFGLFTQFWDYWYGTLRHPTNKLAFKAKLAKGTRPVAKAA
jgi:sterol desaturase/sphingolipid hydroxylase (fatty acid hydroxylase superfamily)